MKKFKSTKLKVFRLLALLLCLTATVPQMRAYYTPTGDDTYMWGTAWNVNTANNMTQYSGNSNYYYLVKTATVGSLSSDTWYQFQVVENGNNWYNAGYRYGYPANNSGTYTCVFTFNSSDNSYWITGPFTSLTVAGDDTQALGTATWAADNSSNDMTTSDGGVTYTLTKSNVTYSASGSYECKVTSNHAWDSNNVNKSYPSSNYSYSITAAGNYDIVYTFNTLTQELTVTATPITVTSTDYYVVGDEYLIGYDWTIDNSTIMTDEDENGIYTWSKNGIHLNAGSYKLKVKDSNGNWYGDPDNTDDYNNVVVTAGTNGTYMLEVTFDPDTETVTATLTQTAADPTYDIYVRYTGDESLDNVFIYAWDTSSTLSDYWNGSTGGTALSTLTPTIINGYTYYHVTYTSTESSINVIFNENGSSSTQTADLTVNPGDNYFTYGGGSSVIGPTTGPDEEATFYIEGSEGLGLSWSYDPTTTMTFDSSTGLYSYTYNVQEAGTYNFVFANGQGTDWDDFNGNYRIGPESGSQTIDIDGNWVTTQMAGGDNGSYAITVDAGAVTIWFNAVNMTFKVDAVVPTSNYKIYVLPSNGTTVPHLYAWNGNEYPNGVWPGNALSTTETLADGNAWYLWTADLTYDILNVQVNGGDNTMQTADITNLTPGTYYIMWNTSDNSFELLTVAPTAEGDELHLVGLYSQKSRYYDSATQKYMYKYDYFDYAADQGLTFKYDGTNNVYYLNNIVLSNGAGFCLSTSLGSSADDWSGMGTRYGYNGSTVTDNHHTVLSTEINTEMPIGEWTAVGEQDFAMGTAGVFNVLADPVNGWVKLIRTDSTTLTPMNIYLEQTPNVTLNEDYLVPGSYSYDGTMWPVCVFNKLVNSTWEEGNRYGVTYVGDTTTVDGKTWWHWIVDCSIGDVFFHRLEGDPLNSDVIWRKAGVLWVTWDEEGSQSVMTDHTREYFEASAEDLPTNATVVEGHYYVYFINTVGWDEVSINAWGEASPYTDGYGRDVQTWPGAAMECVGVDPVTGYEVWRYDFGPINGTTPPTGILFNDSDPNANNEYKEQTGDFEFVNGGVYDYLGLFDGAYTLNNLIRTAVKNVRYTISNDLVGVYYDRDAKTTIEYKDINGEKASEVIVGALYAKDLNLYGEKSFMPDSTYTDYVYGICASDHTTGRSQIMDKKTDYDQSNWVKLVVSPLYDGGGNLPVSKENRPNLEEYVGHIIPGGKLIVYMDDRINPEAHVLKIEKGAAQTYEPNVYVSAHFNDSIVFAYTHNEWQPKNPDGSTYEGVYRTVPSYVYDTEGNIVGITRNVDYSQLYKMFYVAPKPQEVAYLTWIVYDNPNTQVGSIRPYGDYNSGEYLPQTHAASVLPNDPGEFYAPMNWHRGVAFVGDSLNYLSEEGFGVEYGPYSNGYMQYGGVKVNWSLFGDSIGNQSHVVESEGKNIYWWQIFEPGQAYKIKAIIRYAHDSNGNTIYTPGNGDIVDQQDPSYDATSHVMNAPLRSNGQGDYANMFFTPYDGLDESKFIIFPIEAYPGESNGDGMGNVTAVQEVNVMRTVVSTRYYNLMGISSDKPFDGLNIIVTTYSDGSRTSRKVLR